MWSFGFVQNNIPVARDGPRHAGPHAAFEPRTGTGVLINLTPGQIWSADPGPGRNLQLDVIAGEVWVTQAGDHEDHIVAAGERLALSLTGRIVIQATQDAVLRIDSPGPARTFAD